MTETRATPVFLARCQHCGKYLELNGAIWGQEYPEMPGSSSVPFCSDKCQEAYNKEFQEEKERFLREFCVTG